MNLPKRKHPRLKSYDYSLPGYYVTIHGEKDAPAFSRVEPSFLDSRDGHSVERPEIVLTPVGNIAKYQLLALQDRFPMVRIDKYVIMPTYIHVIMQLTALSAGASPRPTLMDIVGTYKSLTTRAVNQRRNTPGRKLFQPSFYETVLRNENAYQAYWAYIDGNPDKWFRNPEAI